MVSNKQSAIQTVLYSDLFSFPLTLNEIYRYWEGEKACSKDQITQVLQSLSPLLTQKRGYYFFSGKEKNVTRRMRQRKFVEEKVRIASTAARVLSYIPSIRFIGISGSVAVGAADAHDDIDFFIITENNTLFLTRALILGVLQLLGKRRKRNTRSEQNKICVNMLIEASQMKIENNRRDIYTAREITQLMPLFERDATYREFFSKNTWIKNILPHASPFTVRISVPSRRLWTKIFAFRGFQMLEKTIRLFQKRYIMAHKTTETITDSYLAFHPNDYRQQILTNRKNRLNEISLHSLSLPTVTDEHFLDKGINIFYTA